MNAFPGDAAIIALAAPIAGDAVAGFRKSTEILVPMWMISQCFARSWRGRGLAA
ncbi:hypothetical protein APY04_3363 [Hyphomicrobium sulfonivorans]|uniref:Uncharacterized protein n=1 Tax=Hyphomicrobium sulfonivorans TaxID=121290 RepID=A0A109B8W2_HYPSL|nr:hypothetical protein APY04_3363 [Hyphomicrobium sulfonivorans]